jgi:hypothetical protein
MSIPQNQPADVAESCAFKHLQEHPPDQFRRLFADDRLPCTILVIPSLSLDGEVLSRVSGINTYKERMPCLLPLLRIPRSRVVSVSSMPIAESIIDYCLDLLPSVPPMHARRRLEMTACHDASHRPLTQ